MRQYKELIKTIFEDGATKSDRTGTGTLSIFGHQSRYDLREGFPLLTLKKVHWKSVVYELLWFIKGDTNIKYLNDNGVTIWDEWADKYGNLGPVYGHQWRHWGGWEVEGDYNHDFANIGIDQLTDAIELLKKDPESRRNIVSAWNVNDLDKMALQPCHTLFQFYAAPIPTLNGGAEKPKQYYLDLQLYQRSADVFLGVPFNIASYALLLKMVAQCVGMTPRFFIHTLGDAHIYSNHFEQCKTMLEREDLDLPQVFLSPGITNIDDFKFEDIVLSDYRSHGVLKGAVAV